MSYRRIEINLLPPELQPGPVVRSALIINITLILATVFIIGLTAALSLYRYAHTIEDIATTKQSIANLEDVRKGYEQLQSIESAVYNYGKIIGITSTDYVDIPVLLAHLSHIIPDGVYLNTVTNVRAGNVTAASALDPYRATFVSMSFNTSRHDLGQIVETLNALKADPIFGNCVLTNAQVNTEQLAELSEALGMDTNFDVPSSDESPTNYNYFEFIIRAEVRRPIASPRTPVVDDKLELFKASGPLATKPAQDVGVLPGQAQPPAETGVSGGPEGVTGRSNRGGN